MADACRDGRFERFWRAQASSAYRGKDRFHEGPRGAGVDVVRPKKTSAETFETAMFIVTLRTRLEALRTTCARRARQPGTERAPAAAPASQPPPPSEPSDLPSRTHLWQAEHDPAAGVRVLRCFRDPLWTSGQPTQLPAAQLCQFQPAARQPAWPRPRPPAGSRGADSAALGQAYSLVHRGAASARYTWTASSAGEGLASPRPAQ